MNVTNLLLVIILAILVEQFYPGLRPWLTLLFLLSLGVLALYGCYWLVAVFPGQWKKRRAARRQRQKDLDKWWEWNGKREALRNKYDPENKWNEATHLPYEYLDEFDKLKAEYRDVLKRLEETS